MEFARRGRGDDDVADGNRFIHLPPPHVDQMLVIREALLSQLQKDRLRQEIIQAELAKIEHAMVRRNGSHHETADGVEWTKPVPFTFREQSMPPWRWSVSQECYVYVDEIHDQEGRHRSVALKSEKPAMEDGVRECLRPCCCNGKAGQENSKLDEQKSKESSETKQPKTTSPSVKWELTGITIPVKKRHQKLSCEICQVQATSEHSLQEHCAGRKHRSKEASNQKAQLTEESSSRTGQKTCSIKWSCSTCQVNGTSESDLKEHLNGRTHQQNIEAQLMEGDGMAKNIELQEPECHKSNAPQHLEKPPSMFSSAICLTNGAHELELGGHLLAKLQALLDEIRNMSRNSELREATVLPNIAPQNADQTSGSNCSIFQADSDCQLDLEHQIGSKIHQMNVQDLHEDAKKTGNFPPEIAKNQQPPSEWDCVICQAKCYSASQFVHHCSGKKHQKEMDALQGDGVTKSSNLTTENKVPSNGSDINSSSSEKVEEQTALWSCGIDVEEQAVVGVKIDVEDGRTMQPLHETKNQSSEKGKAIDFAIKDFIKEPVQQRLQYKPTDQDNAANSEQKSTEFNETTPEVKRKLTAPSSPVKKQNPLGQWSCTVCQANLNSQYQLEEHLADKRHQSNIAALQTSWSKGNSPEPNMKATPTGSSRTIATTWNVHKYGKEEVPENRWTCTLCQAKCTSESDYHSHLGGRRHRENEEARRASLYCAVCDVQCSSVKMLASHLCGRRHREKLEGSDSD